MGSQTSSDGRLSGTFNPTLDFRWHLPVSDYMNRPIVLAEFCSKYPDQPCYFRADYSSVGSSLEVWYRHTGTPVRCDNVVISLKKQSWLHGLLKEDEPAWSPDYSTKKPFSRKWEKSDTSIQGARPSSMYPCISTFTPSRSLRKWDFLME